MTTKSTYDIAIVLPSRKRPEGLERMAHSLYELADNPEKIRLMVAFDDDDVESQTAFINGLAKWMDERGYPYIARSYPRQGYGGLHFYNNELCKIADSNWLFTWNDDAVMRTQGWDTQITRRTGEFKLFATHAQNDHPYALFSLFPREWFDLFGYFSLHQATDAWISQQAFMLDIYERLPITIDHLRVDLVGGEPDETFLERKPLEGNPSDPRDFHHPDVTRKRIADCYVLADYMRSRGISTEWWERVLRGEVGSMTRMRENDPNGQTCSFKIVNGRMVRE